MALGLFVILVIVAPFANTARGSARCRYYNVIHEKCTSTGFEPRTARFEVQVLGEELSKNLNSL
jgi:hypothetical protein